MQTFISRLVLFALPVLAFVLAAAMGMPWLLSLSHGPTTQQLIDRQFEQALDRDYQQLILGNSRAFGGLDPDVFSVPTYNFAHDNDSYNQMYHKLLYLWQRGKRFDQVILGTDHFQFSFQADTRNHAYADHLGADYLKDFDRRNPMMIELAYRLSNIDPAKFRSIGDETTKRYYLRENGQYVKFGVAREDDVIQRDVSRLPFQVDHFEKLLAFCKEKGLTVFIVMLPLRPNELRSYTEEALSEFDAFIEGHTDGEQVFLLNYSRIDGFGIEDYIDITHFTQEAGGRISTMIDRDVMALGRQGR
jgi:hypothetical protein